MHTIARRFLIVLLGWFCLSASGWAADSVTRVVFQVSDNDPVKWNLALGNVKNLQAGLGAANTEVEVVVYGPGINMIKFASPVADKVAEALHANVKIVACENTMHAFGLSKDDLLEGVGTVPSGVVEIVKRQQAGFVYVRP